VKKFLLKVVIFVALFSATLVLSVYFIPPDVSIKDSFLYSIIDRHEMLRTRNSPKLVFVGGSNLIFGLESKKISEAYGISVVNMGTPATVGLKYTLNDIKPFINKGDIIVVVPEYHFFLRNGLFDGQTDLLYILFDIYPEGKVHIQFGQWMHLLRFLPNYVREKTRPFIKYRILSLNPTPNHNQNSVTNVYSRKALNEYGEVAGLWNKGNVPFPPSFLEGEVDMKAIYFMNRYNDYVKSKGARLYFLYPCYQAKSYDMSLHFINQLSNQLGKNLSFKILAKPERYRFPDNLFFDQYYHLNKNGADIRTKKVIEDLRLVLSNDQLFKKTNRLSTSLSDKGL